MTDTLRMAKLEIDRIEPPERAAEPQAGTSAMLGPDDTNPEVRASEDRAPEDRAPEDKADRPAGLRLQVFTPPPFDEGPLWGTKPDDTIAQEGPATIPWTARHRAALRAGVLAGIGGLLVTAGMIITKLGTTPADGLAILPSATLPSATALTLPASRTQDSAPSAAGLHDTAAPPSDDPGVDPTAAPAGRPRVGTVKASGSNEHATDVASSKAVADTPDASSPASPKEAGKSLILNDAPF